MRNLSTFLTEGVYDTPISITDLYVLPTWVEFRYNGVAVNVDLFDLPDKFFPCTKKNFNVSIGKIEELIIDYAGVDVTTAPNWVDVMTEVRDQLEKFYVKTNRNITEVLLDNFDVVLAYEGEIVSFNLIRYEDEPFSSKEEAQAFVEGQLKPFKSARNYKKVLERVMRQMDSAHYWVSED